MSPNRRICPKDTETLIEQIVMDVGLTDEDPGGGPVEDVWSSVEVFLRGNVIAAANRSVTDETGELESEDNMGTFGVEDEEDARTGQMEIEVSPQSPEPPQQQQEIREQEDDLNLNATIGGAFGGPTEQVSGQAESADSPPPLILHSFMDINLDVEEGNGEQQDPEVLFNVWMHVPPNDADSSYEE